MDLQSIGVFQFENLVRNRIPFVLFNLGLDLSGRFPSFLQTHMESQMHRLDSAQAVSTARSIAIAAESAIVVVAEDPDEACSCARSLFAAGFENVYYVGESLRSET